MIPLRNCIAILILALAPTLATASPDQPLATTDYMFVGQRWLVACKHLPLHARASAFSRTHAILDYRDQVTIVELIDPYELPESQQDRSQNTDSDMPGHNRQLYAWARVQDGQGRNGYAAATCLVNGMLINGPHETPPADSLDPALASGIRSVENIKGTLGRLSRKTPSADAPETAVATRGFSRGVKVDLLAMRTKLQGSSPAGDCPGAEPAAASNPGAGSGPDQSVSARGFTKRAKLEKVVMHAINKGKAQGNCYGPDDDLILNSLGEGSSQFDPYNAFMEFRRAGRLGEFK